MYHDSATPTIHIFNPETDLALACGRESYTPPARILALRRRLELLPALWADDGDIIAAESIQSDTERISPDEPFRLPVFPSEQELIEAANRAIRTRNIKILPFREAVRHEGYLRPWGWNHELRHRLLRVGAAPEGVLSIEEVNAIRSLAHRQTTIAFHSELRRRGMESVAEPVEISDAASLKAALLELGPECYLKAPWSSSGRGIHHLADISDSAMLQKALEWAKGTISRQGSVMIERAEKRVLDFASEWEMKSGIATFKGWSVFRTASSGSYAGNAWAPQPEIEAMIASAAQGVDLAQLAELQRACLHSTVGKAYTGPLGIDMLATPDGRINACVEINLRTTMGRAAIEWGNKQTLQ